MPGYGGGTGGAEADYGEGMGTKGAAAADHSIGTGAGAASTDTSIGAFRSAIAKALGMSQIDREVTFGAPAQPGSPALEAHDMDTDAVRDALQAAGMFDDPSNTDYSDDSPAYDPDAVNRQAYGAPQALDDPQGTEEGLAAAQKAVDAMDGIRGVVTDIKPSPLAHLSTYHGQNTRNFNTTGYDPSESTGLHDPQGTEAGLRAAQAVERSMNLGKRARGARNPGKVAQNNLADLKSKKAYLDEVEEREKRVTELEAIKNRTRQEQNELNNLKSLINKHKMTDRYSTAYATVYGTSPLGQAVKAMAPLGMGMWGPKLSQAFIDRGFVDDRTFDDVSFEIENNVNRPDSFLENYINNLPASAYDEPWMKGLNERQIKYYLDRPSELEWVRNLYNEMNPS